MTPKEKAKELIYKFSIKDDLGWFVYSPKPFTYAKQCALISIDEILEYLTSSIDIQVSVMAIDYWQKVKTEIENL